MSIRRRSDDAFAQRQIHPFMERSNLPLKFPLPLLPGFTGGPTWTSGDLTHYREFAQWKRTGHHE